MKVEEGRNRDGSSLTDEEIEAISREIRAEEYGSSTTDPFTTEPEAEERTEAEGEEIPSPEDQALAVETTDRLTKREPEAPTQHTTPWPADKPLPGPGEPGFDPFTVYVDEETGASLVPS